MGSKMTISRPYLLRGIYEWLIDNNLTPYLLVDAEYKDIAIPFEHVQDGKIILNISTSAIEMLNLENDYVSFSARFSGKAMDIYIPIRAVLALYSMENGKGMMFPEEEELSNEEPNPENLNGDAINNKGLNQSIKNKPNLSRIESSTTTSTTAKKDRPKQKKTKPSFLKVVK